MLTGTASLSGLIGGDIVTLGGNAVAAFANANVGVAKPVTISGDTVSGPIAPTTASLRIRPTANTSGIARV